MRIAVLYILIIVIIVIVIVIFLIIIKIEFGRHSTFSKKDRKNPETIESDQITKTKLYIVINNLKYITKQTM